MEFGLGMITAMIIYNLIRFIGKKRAEARIKKALADSTLSAAKFGAEITGLQEVMSLHRELMLDWNREFADEQKSTLH